MSALRMISSMATREILAALAAEYSRVASQRVEAEAAGGVDVAKRVAAGEAVDVVVLARAAIDKLAEGGHVQGGVDLVVSGIGIAVQRGAAHPDVGSEEGVRNAVANAASLSYSTGPSGVYLEQLFERWGLLESLRSRIVVPPPGVPVGKLVAEGRAQLGFQQLSELMGLSGIDLLGPLPAAIQQLTVFSGAISTRGGQQQAARALLTFLASADSAATKRRYGMEPA